MPLVFVNQVMLDWIALFSLVSTTALTMDIAIMELVSVAKDSLELIVQLLLVPIIVCLVENVLTALVFAHQDGQTLIVP